MSGYHRLAGSPGPDLDRFTAHLGRQAACIAPDRQRQGPRGAVKAGSVRATAHDILLKEGFTP